jgi:hypothetical protein
MSEFDFDADVRGAAYRVLELSRDVPIDSAHKSRLREELLRRHQELSAGTTQRAAFKLWPRLSGLKRLTLVAPPALAGALILSVLFWGLQISGHQKPQTAEAAKITQALARTAPSVTSWQWTLQTSGAGQKAAVYRLQHRLSRSEQLLSQPGRVLLYSQGHWGRLTADTVNNPGPKDWNVAFAVLAVQLSQQSFTMLPNRTVQGHRTEGIRYSTLAGAGVTVTTTMWVEPTTGLVFHIDRVAAQGGSVFERDAVDYRYAYGRSK